MSFDIIKIHWSNALDFFKIQNFKLFILATLNNFLRSLKILLKEFPGLLIIMLISKLCYSYCIEASTLLMAEYGKLTFNPFLFISVSIFVVSVSLVTFFFLLAARPSIELKNRRYFFSHLIKFWGFVLFYMIIPELLYPFLIMSVLFFLDSENKPVSFYYALKNGFKSYVYFLPVTFFLSLLFIIPSYGLMYLNFLSQHAQFTFVATQRISDFFIYFVGYPTIIFIALLLYKFLLTCTCTIYYVKIKHANHQFFFDKR